MTINDLEYKLIDNDLPGYLIGLERTPGSEYNKVSHIYKGEFNNIEKPMCKRGYNRADGFSIWRNNLGKWICRTCLKNTLKDLAH